MKLVFNWHEQWHSRKTKITGETETGAKVLGAETAVCDRRRPWPSACPVLTCIPTTTFVLSSLLCVFLLIISPHFPLSSILLIYIISIKSFCCVFLLHQILVPGPFDFHQQYPSKVLNKGDINESSKYLILLFFHQSKILSWCYTYMFCYWVMGIVSKASIASHPWACGLSQLTPGTGMFFDGIKTHRHQHRPWLW